MKTRSKRRTPPRPATRVIDATERLAGGSSPVPPPTRGRLFYDFEIPDAFLGGLPRITHKVRWVREHFPRHSRVKVGRDSAWFEADIRAHLDSLADLQATG